MFRPERMTSTSIICLRKDVDNTLKALNDFSEFHIEHMNQSENPAEYDLRIRQVEEALTDLEDLKKQLNTEKPALIDIFRSAKPTRIQVTVENWQTLSVLLSQKTNELKQETQILTSSLDTLRKEDDELNHIHDMLSIMDAIDADLVAMEELHLINIVIASVPSNYLLELNKALTGFPIVFNRCYLCKKTDFICLAFPAKYRQNVEKILKTHHGEIFEIPQDFPHNISEATVEATNRINEIEKKKASVSASLQKLGKSNQYELVALTETAENVLTLLHAKKKILQSGRLATLKGFVPKKKLQTLRTKIDSTLKGNSLVFENEVAVSADPPTLVRHNRFVRPFEEITKLYGLPHYDELDPTPIIALTFPLIFGLMFGDIGHGLVLLIGGLLFGFLIKNQSGIKNVCWILAACGLGAIFAGFLFGEFFGLQVFAPIWFNPFDNVLMFLIFSLFVGIIQIMSGLALELIDHALKRNLMDILLTSIPKIAFYAGSVYLIATYQLNFGAWLSGPILFALVPFLVFAFGKTAVFAISKASWRSINIQKDPVTFSERLFESGDLVTRLLSNTMSYTRILALLMAHWALIMATYSIAGLAADGSLLGLVASGVIIVGGNIFVIALEGLIVFIHSLRLHFYEWFSKFYQGTGTPFSPFKQNFVYTEVTLGEKQKNN